MKHACSCGAILMQVLAIVAMFVTLPNAYARHAVTGPPAKDAQAAPAPFKFPTIATRATQKFLMRSRQGLEYQIQVSVPQVQAPAAGFPVIYVTDGNAWFGAMAEVARLNDLTARPIVVGIGYPTDALLDLDRRIYDLTEPTPYSALSSETLHRKNGGAAQFLKFINGELKPRIEREHRIDTARQTLFGHSLGGLFSLYVMFTKPESFQSYIAASPSIWWNHKAILKHEKRFVARAGSGSPRLIVTAGEYEQFPPAKAEEELRKRLEANPQLLGGKTVEQAVAIYRRQLEEAREVDNCRELVERLTAHKVNAVFVKFAGEDHMSVVVPAINRAVPFVLAPQ